MIKRIAQMADWKYVVSLLVVMFMGALSVIYGMASTNENEIHELSNRVTKQEAIMQRVEDNTTEMRQDIKTLLRRRGDER